MSSFDAFLPWTRVASRPPLNLKLHLLLTIFRDINPADLSQAAGEDSTALAILRKKASPNKLIVDDATNDDNSVITMHTNTMDKLGLFRGDTVLVRGKKRKDTVLIVLADDEVDETKVRLNKGTQLYDGLTGTSCQRKPSHSSW